MTECTRHREVLSAGLDDESDDAEYAAAVEHETGCADCAQWYRDTVALSRSMRIGEAVTGVDLSAAVLAAATDAGLVASGPVTPPRRRSRLTLWRIALAVVALGQLSIGLSQLLGAGSHSHGGADAGGHLFNESTAWNVALGFGFAAAVAWPRTARGLAPVAAVFLVVLLGFSVADLAAGTTTASRVASHTLVLVGTILLLLVTRAVRHQPEDERHRLADDATLYGTLTNRLPGTGNDGVRQRRAA